jgi:hypothetical protein
LKCGEDDGLRLLALERLGSLAPALAREAVERATVEVETDVLEWQGSLGAVRGHLVVLWLEPELFIRVSAAPSAVDAITAAVAFAVSRVSGNALAELKIRSRAASPSTPYRGRV